MKVHTLLALFIVISGFTIALCEEELDPGIAAIFELEPESSSSEVWGLLNIENAPWIWSYYFGWMYLTPDSLPKNYWIWIEGLGWLNSSAGEFPIGYLLPDQIYRFPDRKYRFPNDPEMILLQVTQPVSLKYWGFESRKWIETAPRNQEPSYFGFDFYPEIPGDLRGLSAESSRGPYGMGYFLVTGPYYLTILRVYPSDPRSSSHLATISYVDIEPKIALPPTTYLEDYYYNPDDDSFYPMRLRRNVFKWGVNLPSDLEGKGKLRVEGDSLFIEWTHLLTGEDLGTEIFTIVEELPLGFEMPGK